MSINKHRKAMFVLGFCVILFITMYVVFCKRTAGVHEPTLLLISSSEARVKINENKDAFILDVRTSEEFNMGRIPGAVNIPYLMIAEEQGLLPHDKQHLIFVYCRTGRRAETAAYELVALGYTNIVVFPGMMTWIYETVTD